MNAVTELLADDDARASETAAAGHRFTLRRTGRKPVRFAGWKMVEAVGGGETAPLHYDLAIYRTTGNHFLCELIARRAGVEAQDIFRVESFAALDPLTQWLQSHDCATDVPVPSCLAAQDGPLALAVLHAVRLRDTIARIEGEYQDLLSDVFAAIGVTDAPDIQSGGGDRHDA
jgi:hypothetical protein